MDKYFKIVLDLLLNADVQLTSLDILLQVNVMERFAFEGEGRGGEEGKEGIADGGRDMRGGKEGKEGRRRSIG